MTVAELPEAKVEGEGQFDWASQARQYPKVGPPGLTEQTVIVAAGVGTTMALDPSDGRLKPARVRVKVEVDCLLYRNRKGALVGILNHYPEACYDMDGNLLERPGNVNVWVRPNRRGRGVGSLLLHAALDRWDDIDPAAQDYTAGGRALMAKVLDERGGR